MPLMLVTVFMALMFSPPSWSQDRDDEPAAEDTAIGESAAAEPEDAESDAAGPAVDLDADPELDQQTYEKDDDEFIPTEEIPVDQSIPFPTDI